MVAFPSGQASETVIGLKKEFSTMTPSIALLVFARLVTRYADPKHVVSTTETTVPPVPAISPYFGGCS